MGFEILETLECKRLKLYSLAKRPWKKVMPWMIKDGQRECYSRSSPTAGKEVDQEDRGHKK